MTTNDDKLSQDLNIGCRGLLKHLSKLPPSVSGLALTFNKVTKEVELHTIVKVNSKYVTVDTPFWTSGSGNDRTFTESKPDDCVELFNVMVDLNTPEISKKISEIKKSLKKK